MDKNRVLVVVAHPDDETIGMGGTIRKHINQGDDVFVIAMTDGTGSRDSFNKEDILKRVNSSNIASDLLGFKWLERFNFKDNMLDNEPLLEIIKLIEKSKKMIQPNLVYSHCGGDLNIDHRVVVNAVLTAFRPQPNDSCSEIRLFEISSATDFGNEFITGKFYPNLFVDISNTWDDKEKSLLAYEEELRDFPHSRSLEGIKNLANLRGNQVGLKMAEAFQIIRKINF
ncbi:PIG-L deacetylase family protein [Prochlorococcus sp. MIT 0604]|uniref:PIG-L deacetylase family protein n=1 Tax=Prochlorococcus sp. MIT 0604 TaxID=1501268 RepID=UPI0004F5E784|nr:PIG-L family deacetylase [Prochlorococcus sp. MIT 0604]AIQ95514.1 putative LmbE-like protein [Prochlorococcus sp. MIT 0604]